jgi:hypothetical protein
MSRDTEPAAGTSGPVRSRPRGAIPCRQGRDPQVHLGGVAASRRLLAMPSEPQVNVPNRHRAGSAICGCNRPNAGKSGSNGNARLPCSQDMAIGMNEADRPNGTEMQPEDARSAGRCEDIQAERADQPQNSVRGDAGLGHESREPRTRAEYAEDMRAHSPVASASDATDSHATEPPPRQSAADNKQEELYVDGLDVEVTHNPAEGLWVEGLPGEIPDKPVGDPYGTAHVGDVLYGFEGSKLSKIEELNQILCEHLDDIGDEACRDSDTIQDLLDKNLRPTHSAVYERMPAISPEGTSHAINIGHGVDAVLAIAAINVSLANRFNKKRHRE